MLKRWAVMTGFSLATIIATAAGCGDGPTTVPSSLQTLDPTDPSLRYTGRWDRQNPEAPWAGWAGSEVALGFVGSAAWVELDPGTNTEYFRIVIDGDPTSSRKFKVTPGPGKYLLAENLEPGSHTVEIVKETEYSDTAFLGFEVLGTGVTSKPKSQGRRIEFYGDSNLAGYSLEHEKNQPGAQLEGTHFGYAGITARMFEAAYHNISWSGSTIPSVHAFFDRIDPASPAASWDFSRFRADVVVVNLGANDVGRPVADIQADYHAFLDDLRTVHPAAHIVLFNAWGWSENEPANYTHEVVASRDDPNMSAATFPWVFERWHGCEYDHGGMAVVLAEHLEQHLGWEAGPSDVMSGFGRNGDVANGGFEETAPFGGYGWRYREDPGVRRRIDPELAYAGKALLELADGAASHQPNPATGGDRVTLSFWARAPDGEATVEATVDFRDQNMYSAPLVAQSEVFALGTEWQQVQVVAVAPIDSPKPVFHTRVTLQAATGSVVHVDEVATTTRPKQ
ncbi:MAG: GDSL-type esterase/lipase family protein [Candidatus Binatia bacterium]|nr:GDSL-type esterase/lipase family protein [Candidatus Binatia bacterium]